MRINRFIALATGMSRRAADQAIVDDKVRVNNIRPVSGQQVEPSDTVTLDGVTLESVASTTTIILNKPVGYVCSRDGQGSKTIYDLLPSELHKLKPVGRLDKDSSGLLLLTNDGKLAHQLTHPSYGKGKVYEVHLSHQLKPAHLEQLRRGVTLEDGPSKLKIQINKTSGSFRANPSPSYEVRMSEGRNRQIRRTFAALDYKVTSLSRIEFGNYTLDTLASGKYSIL